MGDKGFSDEVIAAIVDEAKKQNIPVVAHIGNVAQVKQLADMGVTDFMHEARDGMNPEFIAYAKAKGLSFAPTLGQGQSRWYYYEHPEVLTMDPRFDGFYARGRAMLNDPERRQQIMGAADFAETKKRFKDNNYPFIKMMHDAGIHRHRHRLRRRGIADDSSRAHDASKCRCSSKRDDAANALRAATLDSARARADGKPELRSDSGRQIADIVVLECRSNSRYQQHHQDRSSDEGGQMGSITAIYEKHRSLFGDQTVNGRRQRR